MSTLTEFLLARVAEDEAELGVLSPYQRDEPAGPNGVGWAEVGAINEVLIIGHRRALAECQAKREMLEQHLEATWIRRLGDDSTEEGLGRCDTCADWAAGDFDGPGPIDWPCPTLRALAAVYSDHPDYEEACGEAVRDTQGS